MTNLYGVFVHRGMCDDILMAFADEAEAQEMVMDLHFEKCYEAFCYYMSQEDVYWFCGGDKYRNVFTEVEVALNCSRFIQEYYHVDEFPAFITLAPYC